jgi:lactate dehydrogenase-like 2-hydroxyacid dehydrogenase
MIKFDKITIIDKCGLTDPILEKLTNYSTEPIKLYHDFPKTEEEIKKRIGDSDCILVSWQTIVSADIINASKSLKFIGMCCSLYDEQSANVDIVAARKLGIDVKGVKDYGDDGTIEFIFAELICLFKGLGKQKWRIEQVELKNKSIGIIGLGTVGLMVAKTAAHFGMQVYYFSRTRKQHLENEGLTYLPLEELLKTCDVVTTHLPKHTVVISAPEFKLKKRNSVLVSTSIGLNCDKDALINWLTEDKTSYAIFDSVGVGIYGDELRKFDNVILSDQSAGFTNEAKERLSEKVLNNLTQFLSEN